MVDKSESGGMPPRKRTMSDSTMQRLNIKRNIIIATGQSTYEGIASFKKGSHNLWVFVNGKKEYCGGNMDYIELSDNTIKFNKLIPKGAVIEVIVFESIME